MVKHCRKVLLYWELGLCVLCFIEGIEEERNALDELG
jgi:hypothetical protein